MSLAILVVLTGCGQQTPAPSRTSPWLSGTATYVSVGDSTDLVAGTSTRVEAGVGGGQASVECIDVVDSVVAGQQGISLNLPSTFEGDPVLPVDSGPGLAISLDSSKPADNSAMIFRDPANPSVVAPRDGTTALEGSEYQVDSQTVRFVSPSSHHLTGSLTIVGPQDQRIDITLDLICNTPTS